MEQVKEWTDKAEHDLKTAEVNLREGIFDASAFYSQQAAEKGLKAVFIDKYKKLLKTHDLLLLSKKVKAPEKIVEISKELTQHYIATRYPAAIHYSKDDAIEALDNSREVMGWVRKILSAA